MDQTCSQMTISFALLDVRKSNNKTLLSLVEIKSELCCSSALEGLVTAIRHAEQAHFEERKSQASLIADCQVQEAGQYFVIIPRAHIVVHKWKLDTVGVDLKALSHQMLKQPIHQRLASPTPRTDFVRSRLEFFYTTSLLRSAHADHNRKAGILTYRKSFVVSGPGLQPKSKHFRGKVNLPGHHRFGVPSLKSVSCQHKDSR